MRILRGGVGGGGGVGGRGGGGVGGRRRGRQRAPSRVGSGGSCSKSGVRDCGGRSGGGFLYGFGRQQLKSCAMSARMVKTVKTGEKETKKERHWD